MALDAKEIYRKQVQLLIRVLPLVDTEKCFALKGGTAINLFYRALPRLSVDIDLLYIPMDDRDTALINIRAALSRISKLIQEKIPGSRVQDAHDQSDALRLIVSQDEIRIKVELSPVIRGTVFPEVRMEIVEEVETEFGYVEMQVASHPDLYAGKLCAALDRQHPRDLFDVKFLLENEGLTDDLRKTFLIFLISHQRPMSELLNPHRKNISEIYETEFKQMAEVDVPLEQLEEVREHLIHQINSQMTDNERQFLLSFKNKTPDWNLLEMENIEIVANLPSVLWKMINLKRMPEQKHKEVYGKLKNVLYP
ncbi:nucleotidyl transferase AbiEii/AbiGii toxin family protein [Flavobacterium piscis]|uniref:Nucleotidyltransferase component of viral defense system n=1 Tax=Flavobacterium piscis TaxID=1114874 RepID=A0ABU1Y393_9FLAO|nr:nucleotidyl transferase AbiEii/AbiGii toxin family protein [Flavobacterium piscis]MDR7208697.1 putative nucleotidyltransferase component of viral defense system [Flavobacterium piscis]